MLIFSAGLISVASYVLRKPSISTSYVLELERRCLVTTETKAVDSYLATTVPSTSYTIVRSYSVSISSVRLFITYLVDGRLAFLHKDKTMRVCVLSAPVANLKLTV